MNVGKISFGSSYIISSKMNSASKMDSFAGVCNKLQNKQGVNLEYECSYNPHTKKILTEHFISVPDNLDNYIETYCAKNGIKYKKYIPENKEF